jgi:hypothetical protein
MLSEFLSQIANGSFQCPLTAKSPGSFAYSITRKMRDGVDHWAYEMDAIGSTLGIYGLEFVRKLGISLM